MISRIKNLFNEEGSLPAIMGAAILISATSILLGSFAIATSRNAEVSISKTSLNAALSNCETSLSSTVAKTFYQDTVSDRSNLLHILPAGATETSGNSDVSLQDLAVANCNYSTIRTTVRVLAAENFTPSDATVPDSVKVTFQAAYTGVNNTSIQQVRYLKYAKLVAGQATTANSYIASFDEFGNAVWVDLVG